ncbi:MAG: NACHT domain-containing protein, partial [bacterium]|nr:NACHT domain-containing protein [bacterium]
MPETSSAWPYLRAIGKALTIPGTKIGLGILVDIQDKLDADETQRELFEALDTIRASTSDMVALLKRQAEIEVSEQDLDAAALQLAEALYLYRVARKYLYSDFKGIEQMEKLVPLKLDDVFVNLRVRYERSAGERHAEEAGLLERARRAGPAQWDEAEQRLSELDVAKLGGKREGEAQPVDRVLARSRGVVLLGAPGSGKTTLVKRLARSFALGADIAKERYPELPWSFPVVVPVAFFDEQRDGRGVVGHVRERLRLTGGAALVEVFEHRWSAGDCLVLLDGLDEVADAGRRIGCARAVGELLTHAGKNRMLVTSRPVGYGICRISVPAEHVVLQPFERSDVDSFVKKWHLAYDQAVHPESPDPRQAAADADALIKDIGANPRVESLATNPLMLTIIALIKQQNVGLPERRVQLYEIILNTLIRSWNKARSLANRPVGEDLSAEETKKIWAAVAHWMHREKSTGTCHRQQVQERLVEVLIEFNRGEIEAEKIAESYIAAAAERSGLLEERGTNVFAFLHQTFQEYLAARHLRLARPSSGAIERILEVTPDPRWHEVVRLAAGFIGVVQEDDGMVTELVMAIADDERDPLEPYLCGSLRLAASCLADDVRVAPREAGRVVAKLCERIGTLSYEPVVESVAQSLASMRSFIPDASAVTTLGKLFKHDSWQVRMEAARMLSRATDLNNDAVSYLRDLFRRDSDSDVKAHAALGLWRAGEREDAAVVKAIVHGLTSDHAKMQPPGLEFLPALIQLLEHDDADVRWRAASVLGNLGPQAEATPALIQLLEDDDASVRLRAAEVLCNLGPQAEATPALIQLLEHDDADVRLRAAEVLCNLGPQAEATPALIQLLEDDDA